MGFKNFLISIIKSLIVVVVVMLVFSTVTLDFPALIKGVFSDIFAYASPEVQKEIVAKLTAACSELEGKDFEVQGNANILPLDLKKIGTLCKDYNSKKINDREFFFGVIGNALPGNFELPKVKALEKYNAAMDFLNKNKIVYFAVLLALLVLLYVLASSLNSFLLILTQISFSFGILILLPYVAIIVYDKFVGIDTTQILASILGGTFSPDIKAIISVILLMILRTYTGFIITLGAIFLSIGIAGKVYRWRLKKLSKTAEQKTEKKSEKISKEEKTNKEKSAKENEEKTKEEIEEAYKHRDRTTKEILDELEEMNKKKSKKT